MAIELTTWRHSQDWLAGQFKVLAFIRCPRCSKEFILSGNVHQVSREGTVTPSVVCPCTPCDFHEFVTLKDWTYPDWFIAKNRGEFCSGYSGEWCLTINRKEKRRKLTTCAFSLYCTLHFLLRIDLRGMVAVAV